MGEYESQTRVTMVGGLGEEEGVHTGLDCSAPVAGAKSVRRRG